MVSAGRIGDAARPRVASSRGAHGRRAAALASSRPAASGRARRARVARGAIAGRVAPRCVLDVATRSRFRWPSLAPTVARDGSGGAPRVHVDGAGARAPSVRRLASGAPAASRASTLAAPSGTELRRRRRAVRPRPSPESGGATSRPHAAPLRARRRPVRRQDRARSRRRRRRGSTAGPAWRLRRRRSCCGGATVLIARRSSDGASHSGPPSATTRRRRAAARPAVERVAPSAAPGDPTAFAAPCAEPARVRAPHRPPPSTSTAHRPGRPRDRRPRSSPSASAWGGRSRTTWRSPRQQITVEHTGEHVRRDVQPRGIQPQQGQQFRRRRRSPGCRSPLLQFVQRQPAHARDGAVLRHLGHRQSSPSRMSATRPDRSSNLLEIDSDAARAAGAAACTWASPRLPLRAGTRRTRSS